MHVDSGYKLVCLLITPSTSTTLPDDHAILLVVTMDRTRSSMHACGQWVHDCCMEDLHIDSGIRAVSRIPFQIYIFFHHKFIQVTSIVTTNTMAKMVMMSTVIWSRMLDWGLP